MAKKKIDIGLAEDHEKCAFCGRVKKTHTIQETGACRAGLLAREVAATWAEAEEKKSAKDRLDGIDEQIQKLNDEREVLYREVTEEEVLEDGEKVQALIDRAVEEARKEESERFDEHVEEACEDRRREWLEPLRLYGGHQDCLEGAVVGRRLHPQCTCGWNDVATDLERQAS